MYHAHKLSGLTKRLCLVGVLFAFPSLGFTEGKCYYDTVRYNQLSIDRFITNQVPASTDMALNRILNSNTQLQPADGLSYLGIKHMGDPGSYALAHQADVSSFPNLNIYTGVNTLYQKGYSSSSLFPPNAFQFGYEEQSGGNFNAVGILINTKQFPHTQPIQGGGPHAIHQIIYSNNTYPWAANNNPLLDDHFSELVFQVYLRNKLLTTEGTASAGIGWGAYFQDEFGNVFPYVIQIADSRALGNGNGSETTAHDTGTPFVSVPLLSNTCYATRSPFSASMKNVTPFGRQFFRVHIPRQSFLDAVTALRARNNINFSTDIKKYRLTSINVGTEVNVVGNSNNVTTGIAIDNLSVFIGKSPVTATWAPVMLVNGSFEAHRFAPGFNAFVYTPSPTGWTFSGASGVQRDGSAWGATKAPDGDNTAFLPSGTGVGISQNVHFAAPGGYRLSFKAARRAGQIQPISLRLDGIEKLFFTPPGISFSSHSIDFNVATAGSRQISFIATDQSGDKTTFIDNVSIAKIY